MFLLPRAKILYATEIIPRLGTGPDAEKAKNTLVGHGFTLMHTDKIEEFTFFGF